jgi:hypothetical protein
MKLLLIIIPYYLFVNEASIPADKHKALVGKGEQALLLLFEDSPAVHFAN